MNAKYIGTCIKARRKLIEASIYHVAAWSGLSHQTIVNIEQGKGCKLSTLSRICNSLNMDLAQLLTEAQDDQYRFSAQPPVAA